MKVITPCSQQMAANFLLHMVSILRYVSRQQGETNCETVDENSQDLLAITKEIIVLRPTSEEKKSTLWTSRPLSLVSLVISGLPQHTEGFKSAMSSTGELTFKKGIKVRNGIMASIATLTLDQRWELVRYVTLDEWQKLRTMGIPRVSDRTYLLIAVADHNNKRKTGRPHDMVVAMGNQIKGVIQRYIKKARPVILSHHGQDNADPKSALFPSSVASAAANNF